VLSTQDPRLLAALNKHQEDLEVEPSNETEKKSLRLARGMCVRLLCATEDWRYLLFSFGVSRFTPA
jgi:hypothetical protein